MKLFTNESTIKPSFSLEELKAYHNGTTAISQEAISDYLYKLKDSLATITASTVGKTNDSIVTDTLSTRFETEHVLKRINFPYLQLEVVSKPDRFVGNYADYAADLLKASEDIVAVTTEATSKLKLAIASFINEYSPDKVITIYGLPYFKQAESETETYRKKISKYFTGRQDSVVANIADLIRTPNELDSIYSKLQYLDKAINQSIIRAIDKEAKDASALIDLLIEQNTKSGILLKNDSTKKQLVNAVYITARSVEFTSYLYSNCIYFYSAIKSLSESIIKFGNMK